MIDSTNQILKRFISGYLDHDVNALDLLAKWCRDHGEEALALSFKEDLYRAIKQPGIVTPEIYERWTGLDFEDQAEVQERLQEIWDACFE